MGTRSATSRHRAVPEDRGAYRLQVFGQVRLTRATGAAISLRPLTARVVSALAFRRDRSSEVQRLVDLVWSSSAPDQALKSLQNSVAALRSATHAAVVETVNGGYRLGASVSVDRWTLRHLATDITPHPHRLRLDDVLGLFEGEPWGLIDDLDVIVDIQAVESERATLAVRLAHQAPSSDLGTVARLMGAMVERRPWDEQLAQAHATVLHRLGRRVEGLAEVERVRRELDSAGLEPGPPLRALEAVIRGGRGPVRDSPAFTDEKYVGRAEELAELEGLVDRCRASGGRFESSLIVGGRWAGKSALVRELRYRHPEVRHVMARCRAFGSGADHPLAEALADAGAPPLPAPAALSMLAPALLVIDDLQWADDATARAVADVVHSRPAGVLLIGIIGPGSTDPTIESMRGLIARNHAQFLTGLSRSELMLLARHYGVDLQGGQTDQLMTATAGNPLIARLLLRGLRDRAVSWRAVTKRGTIPSEVRALLRSQLMSLTADVAKLMAWLGASGRAVDLHTVAAASGVRYETLLAAAERAMEDGLVIEVAPERFAVVHTTLQAVIVHGISRTRLRAMRTMLRNPTA